MTNLPTLYQKCQTNVSFKPTVLMLTLKKNFRFRQSGKMSFTIEDEALIIINN
jgi:hypothetical protein